MAEIKHYQDIGQKLTELFSSNLDGITDLKVFWRIGEFTKGLNEIVSQNGLEIDKLKELAEICKTLNLDIFHLILNPNNNKFVVVISEVKDVKTCGLTQYSQLVGYTLVSNSRFGLLINVDGGISKILTSILDSEPHISKIERNYFDERSTHEFGVLTWRSDSKDFRYTQSGEIKSIVELCSRISKELSD